MGTPLDQLIAVAFIGNGIERVILSMTAPDEMGFRKIQAAVQSADDIRKGNYRINVAPGILAALEPILEDRRLWDLETMVMELRLAVEEYSAHMRRNGS